MKVNIVANTNGKGLWSDEQRPVVISKIEIGYNSLTYYPEEPFNGELRAYFDPTGLGYGSWHVIAYGLIYTDKQWLREFKKALRALGFSIIAVRDIDYSEQGMQSAEYVSMDVGKAFYASWKRMNKISKEEISI